MTPSEPQEKKSEQAQVTDQGTRERYQQLALFSFIVAEIALLPLGMGGAVYFFTRSQVWGLVGGAMGLALGSYRVYLLLRRYSQEAEKQKAKNDDLPK